MSAVSPMARESPPDHVAKEAELKKDAIQEALPTPSLPNQDMSFPESPAPKSSLMCATIVKTSLLDNNRRSLRDRKSVTTYNLKQLTGTSVHTPKKFFDDGSIQKTSAPLKGAKGLKRDGIAPKLASRVDGSATQVAKPGAGLLVPLKLGKGAQSEAVPSLTPTLHHEDGNAKILSHLQHDVSLELGPSVLNANTKNRGQLDTIASQKSIALEGVTSTIGNPGQSGSTPPVGPSLLTTPPLVQRIRLINKHPKSMAIKHASPATAPQPIAKVPKSKTTATKEKVPKTAAAKKKVPKTTAAKKKVPKSNTAGPKLKKPRAVRPVTKKRVHWQVETAMGLGDVDKLNTIKRAAPADDARDEPVTKKLKITRTAESAKRSIALCIYASDNESRTRCVMLTEKDIVANSAVLKHVLESKGDTDGCYDSDDELFCDPSTSMKASKYSTPFICLRPLLAAMLAELDEQVNNLDGWDKQNRIYLKDLSDTPSDALWALVIVWQNWVQTGCVSLGLCPFQRERMLKFARVMEMPVELFRAVKKHAVEEKRRPDDHGHVMWKAGLHPEQKAQKDDREREKYYASIGGHKWEYYKASEQS